MVGLGWMWLHGGYGECLTEIIDYLNQITKIILLKKNVTKLE